MAACCGSKTTFDGLSDAYKRRLWWVIGINAVMFLLEMLAGYRSQSQALQADALDFFGDAVTYGLTLWVIGASLKQRSRVALFKGISLLAMGIWVASSTIYHLFEPAQPQAEMMGAVGLLALFANLLSVALLYSYKDGDANVRSVWLCSRNDAIGNVAVMLAALGVWSSQTAWPDLVVAMIMAGLFLSSAWQIIRQSWREYHSPATTHELETN